MLSPEAPYPLDGGGALRTASLLHYLSNRYDVDLIVFQHPGQRIAESLPPGLARRTHAVELRPHGKDFASRAWRNGERLVRGRPPLVDRFSGYEVEIAAHLKGHVYDVAVLEHFWTASYLRLVRPFARRLVLDLHNVESRWHTSSADAAGFAQALVHRRFAAAARKLERKWLPQCDLVLAASASDADRVRAIAPRMAICVYPNAIPFREVERAEAPETIAFSANMEYEPNRVGLRWFAKNVWPPLKVRFPTLKWKLIGKNAHALPREIPLLEGVTCTGWVADPFESLSQAQICIAPLQSGSGTRLKIIEAWAAGCAVVSTSIGAEGLGAVDGESICIADTPETFENAVGRLLSNAPLRQKIAKAGRELYLQRYTWAVAWETLNKAPALHAALENP